MVLNYTLRTARVRSFAPIDILAHDVKKTPGEADAIPRMTNCFSTAVINYRTCRNIAVRFNCDGRKVTVPPDGARAARLFSLFYVAQSSVIPTSSRRFIFFREIVTPDSLSRTAIKDARNMWCKKTHRKGLFVQARRFSSEMKM